MSGFTVFLIVNIIIIVVTTIYCFTLANRQNNKKSLKIDIDSRSQVVHMKKFMKTELFKYIMQL